MKRRQFCAAALCAALLMTALSGTEYTAKADGQDGSVEEILLVRSQAEGDVSQLTEVFRTYSEEGEKSEQISEDVLRELGETSDTAVLIFGRDGKEEGSTVQTTTAKKTKAGQPEETKQAELQSDSAQAEPAGRTAEAPGEIKGEDAETVKATDHTKAKETKGQQEKAQTKTESQTETELQTEAASQADAESKTEPEPQEEQAAISESQQKLIEQVAAEFEQVVVVFNNFRPYGLEILNSYPSIKTITMVETEDEEELLTSAELLVGIVSGSMVQSQDTQAQTPEIQTEEPAAEEITEVQSQKEETAEVQEQQTETGKDKADSQKEKAKKGKRPLGDVNGDGKVDSQDAAALMSLDSKTVTEEILAYADVTGDKKINKKDVKQLLKYISGEIKTFEGEGKQEG